jgi:glucosylceramidase
MKNTKPLLGLFLFFVVFILGCAQQPQMHADWWLTSGDGKTLLKKQDELVPTNQDSNSAAIIIDTASRFQTVDGFGYTLTGGSAQVINAMESSAKRELLQELFGQSGIKVSYLRISVGASDLNADVFTYDDVVFGQSDPQLQNFSLDKDKAGGTGLIPLLKEILVINPNIKILASPWTAPIWMKNNNASIGGSLLKEHYRTYANYLVKYIQQMKAEGINIDALTLQNEPLHGGNNPSMLMLAEEQAIFIGDHVGPMFRDSGIKTKIIAYDHNCNKPEYPITVLNDSLARQFVDGSAFHLYEGDISALSTVKQAHPDKNLYFTEQWTGAKGTFDGDLNWHVKNVLIGSMRNWSKVALEWNLANDAKFEPHTPGGCTECKGAITITHTTLSRNVAYYIIGHASKFVPAGSVRIGSSGPEYLSNVAFITPSGQRVLLVQNDNEKAVNFNIKIGSRNLKAALPPKSVATYEIIE